MKPKANDIGQHLVKLRGHRRLTQDQLAAKLQINGANITRQVVANIEARRRRVYEHQIRLLVKVLHCSFDDLFVGTPPTSPKSNPSALSKPPRR
jgi:transcriptional regulator with XRE-family HTH domain